MDIEQSFDDLIEQSRSEVRARYKSKLFGISSKIEKFISTINVPILDLYTEDNYYTIVCFPPNDFPGHIKATFEFIKTLPNYPNGYQFMDYINGYITELKYDNNLLLRMINIFYPINNTKYDLPSYRSDSRFVITDAPSTTSRAFVKTLAKQKEVKRDIVYIHPKFTLEEIFARMYSPSEEEDLTEELERVLNDWKKIGYNSASYSGNNKQLGTDLFNKYKHKMTKVDIDKVTTNALISLDDLEYFLDEFKDYKISKNFPKSAYDSRLVNLTIRDNNGMMLLKLWIVLDHELIPLLPDGRTHILVNLRLLIADHIIYDVLGNQQIANIKLMLFNRFLNKYNDLKSSGKLTPLDKCKYIGEYFSNSDYLKTKRLIEISERMEKRAALSKGTRVEDLDLLL